MAEVESESLVNSGIYALNFEVHSFWTHTDKSGVSFWLELKP